MLYSIAVFIFRVFSWITFKMEIEGKENVPQNEAVVLCSNHSHWYDAIALAVATKRQVHFIAKKEIFSNKFFGLVLNGLGVIPVDRENASMDTYKSVMKILKAKKVFGIFAQGTRVSDIDAKSAKSGVALFALKGEACIVPVYVNSVYKFRSKVTIKYGTPMTLEEYKGVRVKSETLEAITESVFDEITKLSKKS